MAGVSHFENIHDYTFCRERFGQRFLESEAVLFIDFLTQQRTINAAYYSKLVKQSKAIPSFKTKRSISQKRLSRPQQRASAHRRCDNINIGRNALECTSARRRL